MAQELKLTVGYTYQNGSLKDIFPGEVFNISQTGQALLTDTWDIGTSEETYDPSIADADLGYCVIRNLSATNYIQIGVTTTVYFAKLKPGEIAIFRWNPGVTIYGKANTASVKAKVTIFQD